MRLGTSLTALLFVFGLLSLGCGGSGDKPSASTTNTPGSAVASGQSVKLQGTGASFPAPLYQQWFKAYSKLQKNVKVDYQAKGSGAGITDFINKTVDFAASDAAMKDEEIAKVEGGVVLLPLTAGKVVLAYNVEGVKQLKLSRDVYTKIFLGKIANWNDPAIAKDNPDVKFPDLPITLAVRSDSSGTTFVFTQHLTAISDEWKNGPSTSTAPKWPDDAKVVKAPKNDGITSTIRQTPGAIGYIEYSFGFQTGLPMAELENKSGKFVAPTMDSGKAALATVEMPDDLRGWVKDPEGDACYPIVTYTWLLCYKKGDAAKSAVLKDVVKYCLTEGQKSSAEMGFIPLPENVVELATKKLETIE